MKIRIIYILFNLIMVSTSFGQSIYIKGQLNSWLSINPGDNFQAQGGIRYIPTLSIGKNIKKYKFDSEFSFNTYGSLTYQDDSLLNDGNIKPYRLWLRFSMEQFELRAGLQKINFGSATMLRPLMWFDKIDPRDPLQLTDGVYAILARYYLINNANIWLWGLLFNENIKGWESVPSNTKRPEFGGRMQFPASKGEFAVSYHNREADYTKLDTISHLNFLDKRMENKVGFDCKFDIGVGLWLEAVAVQQDIPIQYYPWQQMVNLGIDYTFGIGNGLNVMNEFLWVGFSKEFLQSDKSISFSALTLNYPIGLFDNILGMVYYDWTNNDWYRFINWQRTYNKISLYLMIFWNPDEFNIYQNLEGNNLFAGKGIQFMFVFNH